LRLLLPGGRGGAGLSSLRRLRLPLSDRRRSAVAAFALLALASPGLAACGGSAQRRAHSAARVPTPAPSGPALGLTEDNAQLLWRTLAPGAPGVPSFAAAQRELTALHPAYVRLLVNWAALQPDPSRPPALEGLVSGCARRLGPCAAYRWIAGELAAIASQQRADPGGFQVVLDLVGAPAWAAAAPHGCERPGDRPFARPLAPGALNAYRALIADLLALGHREGVALRWWSPWNEPNDPRFITPQRSTCARAARSVSPEVYAELARAMASALAGAGPGHELLLGELGGYAVGSAHLTSLSEFVAALPADVLCLSHTWAVHAYAVQGPLQPPDPVGLLERALAVRGGCAASASIWVTEAGAGAAVPGHPRTGAADELQGGCEALARQVLGWYGDPRVRAILQFSFRDDPAYPVGLVSSDLTRPLPVYGMWLALARARAAGAPPPPVGQLCP
jgi:hypothetical protein